MDWWSVFMETLGDDETLVTDFALGVLAGLVAPYSGVVTGGGRHAVWGARLSVEAATPGDAFASAATILDAAATAAGLPAWPVVRVEIVRDDLLDQD